MNEFTRQLCAILLEIFPAESIGDGSKLNWDIAQYRVFSQTKRRSVEHHYVPTDEIENVLRCSIVVFFTERRVILDRHTEIHRQTCRNTADDEQPREDRSPFAANGHFHRFNLSKYTIFVTHPEFRRCSSAKKITECLSCCFIRLPPLLQFFIVLLASHYC